MIEKKTKKADLERKRTSYLQIGLIVAVSFTLVAFEWSTPEIISPDFSSGLVDELNPEIINAVEISKSQPATPPSKQQTSIKAAEVIVSEKVPVIVVKKPKEIFKNIDPSEFIEETKESEIFIETVKPTKTYNAGSELFEGILPHYKECSELSGKDMFDCISDQINSKIEPKPRNIRSLTYTGSKEVRATFTVDEKGNISEVYVHSSKKYEKDLVKEVKRAIFNLPQMIPGSQGGEPIKARFTLPMVFSIQ